MKEWGWFGRGEDKEFIPKIIIYPSIGQLTENFSRSEFDCKCGAEVPYKYRFNLIELAVNLQVIRNDLGAPIVISSGYRTKEYNASLKPKGAKYSKHLTASAGDCHQSRETSLELYNRIERLIAEGKVKDGGLGLYNNFVHFDIRDNPARWDYR